jgi:HK97 family phage portal protein
LTRATSHGVVVAVPVIVSEGALTAIRGVAQGLPGWQPPTTDALWTRGAHAHLFRSMPAVRTACDILARNIAQLGLHLYVRIPPRDERVRDRTSAPALLIDKPNPTYSRYDFIYRVVMSLAVNGETYIYKEGPTGARTALWFVSPRQLHAIANGWSPSAYTWMLDPRQPIDASNFIRIWVPDPEDDWRASPVLETLRRVIAAEQSRERHQAQLLQNGARWPGVIERPIAAKPWSAEQRTDFRTRLEQGFSGASAGGRIPVLEDGMTFKETSWSPAEMQSAEMFRVNREEITRTHQVPLTVAGILDHATFSNVRELHKQLYQDTLGPMIAQIEGALRLHLLTEYGMFESHYFEFNVNEKLQGSFEESASSFGRAVDGPWMTPNEARGRNNLPRVAGGDVLYPQRGSGTGEPPALPADVDAESLAAAFAA